MVVESWVDLFKEKGDLCRVEYKSNKVLNSDEVIERARSRRGEGEYNLFGNNCEHFARWCKTEVCECEQAETLTSTMVRTVAKTVTCRGRGSGHGIR